MNARECREYPLVLDRSWRGRVLITHPINDNEPAAAQLLSAWRDWLGRLIADPGSLPGYQQLKYSPVNEVILAIFADRAAGATGLEVICKRSSPRGPASGLLGLIGRSRGRRNFIRAKALADRGIGTAAPLAFLERRAGGESWIITEYLRNTVDLDQIALTRLPNLPPRECFRLKVRCISAVAELFSALDRHGMHHRDLKATNVLLSNSAGDSPGECHAFLVDLDGLRLSAWRRASSRRQRLTRLAASLVEYRAITRSDYARFLRRLLPGDDWRTQLRALAPAARRYNRAAETRRQRKWSS